MANRPSSWRATSNPRSTRVRVSSSSGLSVCTVPPIVQKVLVPASSFNCCSIAGSTAWPVRNSRVYTNGVMSGA